MFKNITAALIACGLVTPVWAATDAIFEDPFFTDSQLTVSAKNYWKYLKEENANPKHVHNAWGQGFSAEYQSGYLSDIIGFNVSYTSLFGRCSGQDGHTRRREKRQSLRMAIIHVQTRCRRK
ncbi:OprD family outer membrane porin [Klebsiella aerogenes]